MKTKKASAKKSGATAPASKKAPAAKKPVAKTMTAKKPVKVETPVIEMVHAAPAAVAQPIVEQVVAAPVAPQPAEVQAVAPVEPIATQANKTSAKPAATKPVDPNEVKTRKTAVRTGDIAEGDTDKGGRFEVLLGDVKIGEVAFCSVVRVRDGEPSGFRRSWRGENSQGQVLFTDGKRMNAIVALLVAAMKGIRTTPAEQASVSQGASA